VPVDERADRTRIAEVPALHGPVDDDHGRGMSGVTLADEAAVEQGHACRFAPHDATIGTTNQS
jgi:hypothetical protein